MAEEDSQVTRAQPCTACYSRASTSAAKGAQRNFLPHLFQTDTSWALCFEKLENSGLTVFVREVLLLLKKKSKYMFSLSDFPLCWLMEFTCSLIFKNGVIYLSQKRKKKTYLIWNSRLGRRVRELCDQGSPAHPQETCIQCQQPHSYCLVPVCSELLTTVRSIYYLSSQGITMQWYGLIAQQHAKTYPLHPAQPA